MGVKEMGAGKGICTKVFDRVTQDVSGHDLRLLDSVVFELKHSGLDAGGRTGMDCAMGSKNLKAIAVRGTMDIKIAHRVDALVHNKKFIDQITSAKVNKTQGTLGIPVIWGATSCWGSIRTRNFQYNQMEYADEIEPEAIDDIATETVGPHHMTGCFACQVNCRAQHKVPSGLYAAGKYEEGPEYTSLGCLRGRTGL